MGLTVQQRAEVGALLKAKIKQKLDDYAPETSHMPFHTRLLGADRMAQFSFVHSVSTTLGSSVFEQIATIIARPHFRRAMHQFKDFNNTISPAGQSLVQQIINDLRSGRVRPDKAAETSKVLAVASAAATLEVKRPRIDLFLEGHDGTEYYVDLKSAKPNIGEFAGLKRQLLEWVAIRGAVKPDAKVRTLLAIPYNPYAPEPYDRWTLQGLFDLKEEVLVAEEFWSFLGGEGTYEELLEVFGEVGKEMRGVIEERLVGGWEGRLGL